MQTALHAPRLPRPDAALLLLWIALLSLFLIVPATSRGAPVRTASAVSLEAEDYAAFHEAGGALITVVSCSAARGGLAVDGLDVPGDYLEWPLTLTHPLVFRDSLRSAGAIGLTRRYAVLFLPAAGGAPVAGDTLTTVQGLGVT